MSKVSVILCTYNGERFLQDQLDSIANQTRLPDEVVVGDDVSSDSTVAILENWKQSVPFEVKIHRNEVNLGHNKNFEAGVLRSSGDFLFFCDQDDIWHPDKIERVLNVFESQPETGIVFHNTTVVNANREPLGLDEIQLRGPSTRICGMRFYCPVTEDAPIVSGCCCAVRRSVLLQMLPFFGPHDVSIYCLGRALTHIETIYDSLMDCRFHDRNLSLRKSLEKLHEWEEEMLRTTYKLDVPRFWGHLKDIEKFRAQLLNLPDSPAKREILRFQSFTISHLTNRSRVQRNALIFAPLFLWEVISLHYFRRSQPFRSMLYDLLCGLKLRKVEHQ